MKVGAPTLTFQFLTSLSIALTNRAASGYGDAVIAGMGAVTRVTSMGTLVVFGFLKGFQPIAGFSYGAQNFSRLREAIKISIIWSTVGAASSQGIGGSIGSRFPPFLGSHCFCIDAAALIRYHEYYEMQKSGEPMIVIDLEWNRGYDNKKLFEILQIGAVRQERPGGKIIDTFNMFIHPRVHKRFDLGAKALPELQAARDSELDFPAAMAAFLQWANSETVFAAWGIDDLNILRQNCDYWDIPCIQPSKIYDFQVAFSLLVGAEQQIALYRAAEYCGIPTPFTFHNALNDSVYTAMIGEFLTPDLLVMQSVPRKIRKLAQVRFPRQPKRR